MIAGKSARSPWLPVEQTFTAPGTWLSSLWFADPSGFSVTRP